MRDSLEPGSFALGKSKIAGAMTTLLEKAMAEASKLPEQEREVFAAWILAEIESERRWEDLFARSQGLLAKLAEDARREYHAGLTERLDPDKL
jgi:hypothetical protein